jgi:hypothetical protein
MRSTTKLDFNPLDGSFDEDMAENARIEMQFVETISCIEKQIANIPSQAMLDELNHFLEFYTCKLIETRHSICLHLDQKIAEAEDRMFDALTKHGFFSIDLPGDTSIQDQHAIACLIERKIPEKVVPIFLQAVIDGKQDEVRELLDNCPELLMFNPPKNLVIESKLTWQRFIAEDALTMAVKRKQPEMIELLLPYYDKLPQTEEVIKAKEEALAAWSFYEIRAIHYVNNEIVIPREYISYANDLIDVFSRETFPNGLPGNNGNPCYMRLSDETELAISSLFKRLLPEKAVKADYLDVELALLAVYMALDSRFGTFQNRGQRAAFCVRVIGLIQSVLAPETARIFCESLINIATSIINHIKPLIRKEAAQLKLKNSSAFYRDSRLSITGLGSEFSCGTYGSEVDIFSACSLASIAYAFERIMSSKSDGFLECCAAVAATAQPTSRRTGL